MLDDDFNTPAALALFHRWAGEGALDELRRGLAIFGLGSRSRDSVEAPEEVVALARAPGRGAGARATTPSPIGCETRSRPLGWEVRDTPGSPGGFELVPLP